MVLGIYSQHISLRLASGTDFTRSPFARKWKNAMHEVQALDKLNTGSRNSLASCVEPRVSIMIEGPKRMPHVVVIVPHDV